MGTKKSNFLENMANDKRMSLANDRRTHHRQSVAADNLLTVPAKKNKKESVAGERRESQQWPSFLPRPSHGGGQRPIHRGSTFFGDRAVVPADSTRHRRTSQGTNKSRGRIVHELRFPENFAGLFSTRYSPDGSCMATGFGAGGIQVRSPESGALKYTIRGSGEQSLPVMCVRFNPVRQEFFFAASSCGSVFLCDSSTGEHNRFVEELDNQVNAVDVNLSGEKVVTGGKDSALRIYDVNTRQMILRYRRPTFCIDEEVDIGKLHFMRVFAVRFHPQSRETIISGGWDATVKIWDTRTPNACIRTIHGPHICGDAIDIKEKTILTGSWIVSGSLQLWDMGSGRLIDTIIPVNRPTTLDGEFLYAVNFLHGDIYEDLVVVGGSGTGAVEVISIKNKKVMASFKVKKSVNTIDTYNNNIIFGGMESVLYMGYYT